MGHISRLRLVDRHLLSLLAVFVVALGPAGCTYTFDRMPVEGPVLSVEPAGEPVARAHGPAWLSPSVEDGQLVLTAMQEVEREQPVTRIHERRERTHSVTAGGTAPFWDVATAYGFAGLLHLFSGDPYLGRPARCLKEFGRHDSGSFVKQTDSYGNALVCVYAVDEVTVPGVMSTEAVEPAEAVVSTVTDAEREPFSVEITRIGDPPSLVLREDGVLDARGQARVSLGGLTPGLGGEYIVESSFRGRDSRGSLLRASDSGFAAITDPGEVAIALRTREAAEERVRQREAAARRAELEREAAAEREEEERRSQVRQAWLDAGFTVEQYCTYGQKNCGGAWKREGFEPEEARAWLRAGYGDRMAALWRGAGLQPSADWSYFNPDELAAWKQTGFNGADATKLARRGMTAERATVWRQHGFSADEAAEWRASNVGPIGATRLKRVCARGVESEQALEAANPYDISGRCFDLQVEDIQIVSQTAGLYRLQSFSPVYIEFQGMSAPRGAFILIVEGTGAFRYETTLGADLTVPRLRHVPLAD